MSKKPTKALGSSLDATATPFYPKSKSSDNVSIFDLEAQINFYSQYHNEKVNKYTHMITVHFLSWTILCFLAYIPPFKDEFIPYFPLSANFLLAVFYTILYLAMEPFAAITFAFFLFGQVYTANFFIYTYPQHVTIPFTVGLHVCSWIIQIFTHFYFEKRKPALLDSLFQAFAQAPLFVWLELMFLFGYRKDLAKRIDQNAKKAIAEWKKSSKSS